MKPRQSLPGRIALLTIGSSTLAAVLAVLISAHSQSPALGVTATLLIILPLVVALAHRILRRWSRLALALRDGLQTLYDREFSISIGESTHDELGEAVAAYNSIGDQLRQERANIYQRELLLDTVIQAAPLAMVLLNAGGRIVHSNLCARQFFMNGRRLEGLQLGTLVAQAHPGLSDALQSDRDTLVTLTNSGEQQVYLLSQQYFRLNSQSHRLLLLKQLTRELAEQEVVVWKKVIRVIAHELNNSLAPISSLAHSGTLMLRTANTAQLERVFTLIANRSAHLASFIDGYARFAKLPIPRRHPMRWADLLDVLSGAATFRVVGALPLTPIHVDMGHMEQVFINLFKNAAESGSPCDEIVVSLHEQSSGVWVEILDRGKGLTNTQLRDVLLPFYSTKSGGAGLGLTLCREIVEAHGGFFKLASRSGGGCIASVWLPYENTDVDKERAC
jgi:nitrogen fixation/metabolism regulation signal transduction histidine kinase